MVKSSREFYNPLGLAKKNAQHDLHSDDTPSAHKRLSTSFSIAIQKAAARVYIVGKDFQFSGDPTHSESDSSL